MEKIIFYKAVNKIKLHADIDKLILDFSSNMGGDESDFKCQAKLAGDLLSVKINISDFYFGYQIKVMIYDPVKDEITHKSNFLQGSHECEAFFRLADKKSILKLSAVFLIQDFYGKEKKFSYKIDEILKKYPVVKEN